MCLKRKSKVTDYKESFELCILKASFIPLLVCDTFSLNVALFVLLLNEAKDSHLDSTLSIPVQCFVECTKQFFCVFNSFLLLPGNHKTHGSDTNLPAGLLFSVQFMVTTVGEVAYCLSGYAATVATEGESDWTMRNKCC